MDFDERIKKAIDRGQRTRDAKEDQAAAEAMSEEECKRLHSSLRLNLTDHVESCLRKLADHFPGFRFETVVDEHGWGARVTRDDLQLDAGRRTTFFSRLELVIAPFNKYHVLELVSKGTVRNKEIFNRSHYQLLNEADPESFTEMSDLWVLEYAELYAAQS